MNLIDKLLRIKVWSWLCGVAIIILCAMPGAKIPQVFNFYDKLQHLLAFGVWTFLVVYAYKSEKGGFFAGVLFGIGIEIMQYCLPKSFHRSFDLIDVVADSLGALVGIGFLWALKKIFKIEIE
ncbi:VanZ family protein [Flectobacillus roseus]|uniref:VanZ family protein n=1 Tax=Flectobacillus roseus TaxID=502259 RepID=A0ABT6Y674_9BACT|nr:VanZ family protein [Flectobacillus roseus]MDI9859041.1 VanZ family protein [Flectobacillus roseus]MDI9868264.1 VanZ family protein [Flectobacillus roseus]